MKNSFVVWTKVGILSAVVLFEAALFGPTEAAAAPCEKHPALSMDASRWFDGFGSIAPSDLADDTDCPIDFSDLFPFGNSGTALKVLTVESDALAGISRLEIVRDEIGNMESMAYHPSSGAPIRYTVKQLRRRSQVLKKMDQYDVVLLNLEQDFDPAKGGHANMRYLTSALSRTYKSFRILIEATPDEIVLRADPNSGDRESDQNSYTSVFNHLYMVKNTFLGKVIGLERVIPSFR